MTEQEAYDEVTEKINRELIRHEARLKDITQGKRTTEGYIIGEENNRIKTVDQILQLVEVKHPDQSVPEIDPHNRNCEEGCMDPEIAQQDMVSHGFIKVINKGATK